MKCTTCGEVGFANAHGLAIHVGRMHPDLVARRARRRSDRHAQPSVTFRCPPRLLRRARRVAKARGLNLTTLLILGLEAECARFEQRER